MLDLTPKFDDKKVLNKHSKNYFIQIILLVIEFPLNSRNGNQIKKDELEREKLRIEALGSICKIPL